MAPTTEDKIPDLPDVLHKDQQKHHSYITETIPPFLSVTDSLVSERRNLSNENLGIGSDPYLIRNTVYALPTSEYMLEVSSIPVGTLLTPFHDKGVLEELQKAPAKCSQCRSYFNSFTTFKDSKYFCNICGNSGEFHEFISLPSSYEFSINTPNLLPPTCIFVLDLSSKISRQCLNDILEITKTEEFRFLYKKMSFILLNGGITVFHQNINNFKIIKFNIMSDSKVMPKFSKEGVIDSTANITEIINYISEVKYEGSTQTNSLMTVLTDINKICISTKINVFSDQENSINYEEYLENNQNSTLNLFQQDFNNPNNNSNIVENNLIKVAFYSSGIICKGINNLKIELKNACCTKSIYNADIFLKTSDNLIKTGTVLSSLIDSPSHIHLHSMNSNTTATYSLYLSEISDKDKYFQVEIRFTDYDGVRKIRILNSHFYCSSKSNTSTSNLDPTKTINNLSLFNSVSADTLFAYFIKMRISEEKDINLNLAKILAYYRRKNSVAVNNQLILPELLKILPVLIQSVDKINNLDKFYLINASVEQIIKYFYPKMICLSDYYINNSCKGIRLSLKKISENEVYFLENGKEIIIYIGREVEEEIYNSILLFNESTNEISEIVKNLILDINLHYNYDLSVNIIKAGDLNEAIFLSHMVEDKINDKPSYLDYVFDLHEKIKQF